MYNAIGSRKSCFLFMARSRASNQVQRRQSRTYLVDVMESRQKLLFNLMVLLWLTAVIVFWRWWLDTSHIVGQMRFLINSLVLAWTTLLPGYFLFFVSRMKKPNPNLPIPSKLKVAMVVTKAPSEPWPVVKNTLAAMLAQKYPHDTWLADEKPTTQTLKWCYENGVNVSTRDGVSEYHNTKWPRRTKCKEGNLAYFYDYYGYDRYDFVVQLDADHVPTPGYLEEMIRPFADSKVGYVSAPSICDTNRDRSWAARARLFAEAIMHGPLQAGYTSGFAPLCIGSHYAVRTKALKEIGGLGPELAEDHSTTLLMNANGWRGVHALDAIAHGDGPATFADCVTQEFQWSRSLIILLLTLTPKYWRQLPIKLTFQFLFSQLWYPLFGLSMLTAYAIPIVALVTQTPLVEVSYFEFLTYSIPQMLVTILIVVWLKKQNWLRPVNSPVISWEAALFQLARWPWVIWGTLMALAGVIGRKNFNFKVTPKGAQNLQPLPWRTLLPYFALSLLFSAVSIGVENAGTVQGYYYFAVLNGVTYAIVVLVLIGRHYYENVNATLAPTTKRHQLSNLLLTARRASANLRGLLAAL